MHQLILLNIVDHYNHLGWIVPYLCGAVYLRVDVQCFFAEKFGIAGDAREELIVAVDSLVAKQFILTGEPLRALLALEWLVIAVDCG